MEMVVLAETSSLSKICASTLRRIPSVLIAPKAGGAAPFFFVHGADDASDLTHHELAEQVSFGVVYLLEAVYVGHEHAQRPSLIGHRLQAVFELAVEAPLGEEAREVVAVHELVQLFEEGGFDLILVRVLDYGVAHVYAVSVGEELAVPRLLHYLAVERDGLPCFYDAPQGIAAGFPVQLGVPRFDLHIPHHDIGRERVAAKNELVVGYLEEVAETRSLQDHEVRPVPPSLLYPTLQAYATSVKGILTSAPQAGQEARRC
jgi:hypothetical protein